MAKDDDIGATIDDDGESEAVVDPTEEPAKDAGPKGGVDALKADLAKERKRRQAAEAAAQEYEALKAKLAGKDPEKATDDQLASWEQAAVKVASRAAFREAGYAGTKESLSRLVRMIDDSELEFDPESGEVDGLDEQIAGLKEQFPSLFEVPASDTTGRKTPAPRVKRGQGDDPPKQPSSNEQLAALIMGTKKS